MRLPFALKLLTDMNSSASSIIEPLNSSPPPNLISKRGWRSSLNAIKVEPGLPPMKLCFFADASNWNLLRYGYPWSASLSTAVQQ